jgi:asparagine synthase (glutamine-hydrolysing)
MCGIVGIINTDNESVKQSTINEMLASIKYRGPDDEGVYINNNVGFGHVRLSIIDLSNAGHQPMISSNGRFVIVFNGEIYNYLELKNELKHNYEFRTATDTEVILAAFEKWGTGCLNKFNGMFAFAIYDTINKTVYLVRDRIGIKPLYYIQENNSIIFASDIPAILRILKNGPKENNKTICDYLLFNRVAHSESSFFLNIKKLQHSHMCTINNGKMHISRWYNLRENINNPIVSNEEFLTLFKSSINLRLRSDVPVGVALSGGLDSSAILSMINKKFNNSNIHSFSAIYGQNQKGDESSFINEFSDQLENIHFIKPTAESLIRDIDDYITALVEPVPGTSEYAEFKVMELAKNYCTVVLNGQGADETMAGYIYYFGFYFKELLLQLKIAKLLSEIKNYKRIHITNDGLNAFIYLLLPNWLKSNRYLLNRRYIKNEFIKENYIENEITKVLYSSRTLKESFINHFEYKFEHHLSWGDRSSMWFSLEMRFPFLDHNLVERLLATENEKIIGDGITKRILRESMKDILPYKIANRYDKVGFETPEGDWLRNTKVKEMVLDTFSSRSFAEREIINARKLLNMMELHVKSQKDYSHEIWKCFHLEYWFRKFIDKP